MIYDIFENDDILIRFVSPEIDLKLLMFPIKNTKKNRLRYELIPDVFLNIRIKYQIENAKLMYVNDVYIRAFNEKLHTINFFTLNDKWFVSQIDFKHKPDFNFSDIENEVRESFYKFLDENNVLIK